MLVYYYYVDAGYNSCVIRRVKFDASLITSIKDKNSFEHVLYKAYKLNSIKNFIPGHKLECKLVIVDSKNKLFFECEQVNSKSGQKHSHLYEDGTIKVYGLHRGDNLFIKYSVLPDEFENYTISYNDLKKTLK